MCESLFRLNDSLSGSAWRFTEHEIDFLRRSSRETVEHDRNAIDSEFRIFHRTFGHEHSDDVRGRLLKKDREQHIGAITELYTFSLCHQQDLTVNCHPELEHTTKQPDFIVTDHSGKRFYIEVKAILRDGHRDGIEEAKAEFNDAIDRIRDPNYLIGYTIISASDHQPDAHLLRRFIERQIRGMRQEVEEKKCSWKHEGWELEIDISRRNTPRGPDGRNLSFRLESDLHEIAVYADIKKGVEEKRKRYGNLKHPLVIALNVHTPDGPDWMEDRDIAHALYGSHGSRLDIHNRIVSEFRDTDGIFHKKQVAGVIILHAVNSVGYSRIYEKPTIWLRSRDYVWIAESMGLPARALEANGVLPAVVYDPSEVE